MSLPPLTIIPAGAGSGKTYTIQEKLTKWVRDGEVAPERIAAVTFTEAAADELKSRIRQTLMNDAKVKIEQVLALDQAYITTLHGFGLRLVEEYCFEGGWSPQPRKLSEEEADILIRQTLTTTQKADIVMNDLERYGYRYDHTAGTPEAQFRTQISKMIHEHRMIGCEGHSVTLKRSLIDHIETVYGQTGNAETLENNLHHAVNALLKAFPNSLANLYPANNTFVKSLRNDFHNLTSALSSDVLNKNWALWKSLQDLRLSKRGSALPEGYDGLAQRVMDAAQQLHRHPGPRDDAIIHVTAIAEASQESLEKHAKLKKERGLVDYGDMLGLADHLLRQNPDVLDDLASRIDCVVIDEFQDTNPLQFSLMWALHQKGIPTLIVGDIKQSIMGFQGADARLLSALEERYPKAAAPLDKNWRTTTVLMGFLNETSAKLFGSSYQRLTPKAEFESKLDPLRIIHFSKYNRSHDFFARHTAAQLKNLLDDKSNNVWDKSEKSYRTLRGSDIAVLLPTNKLIEKYSQALRERGYQVQIDESGWSSSRSVQLAYYALSYVTDSTDLHAALYLAVTELGKSSLEKSMKNLIEGVNLDDPILNKLDTLQSKDDHADATTRLNHTLNALNLFDIISQWPNAEQERANLLRLIGEAEAFTHTNPETLEAAGFYGSGLKTFLAWLNSRFEEDDNLPQVQVINEHAIQLTTWHKAKGREWPIVAVCGTYKEFDPRIPALGTEYEDFSDPNKILEKARIHYTPNFIAEETNESFLKPLAVASEQNARRLLYVAMTRAREMLILERTEFTEEKDKNNYWNLLFHSIKPRFENSTIHIGNKSFPCEQFRIEKSDPTVFEQPAQATEPGPRPVIGRRAIIPVTSKVTLTPDTLNPSLLTKGQAPDGQIVNTSQYADPLDMEIDRPPAETGTILHRSFEILTADEDHTHLLDSGTGYEFSTEEKHKLQKAVTDFERWLPKTLGATRIQKEVPITYQHESGSLITGVIDLLIETNEGYWIIDHKTRTPKDPGSEILKYWSQLQAYADGLTKQTGAKHVVGFGVHWIMDANVTMAPLQKASA